MPPWRIPLVTSIKFTRKASIPSYSHFFNDHEMALCLCKVIKISMKVKGIYFLQSV